MPSLRDIKRRIRSVKGTQQITRAMQMVAAAKVRRAQERVIAARPYAEKLEALFKEAVGRLSPVDLQDPLLVVRPIRRVGLIIFSSDRGLCGGYNTNLIRTALAEIHRWQAGGVELRLLPIGRKATQFFAHMGLPIITHYTHLPVVPTFAQAQVVVEHVVREYRTQALDKVVLLYTRFVNLLTYRPSLLELLPVLPPSLEPRQQRQASYIFEPSAGVVIGGILPKYLETLVYRAFLESAASELAARMTAMSAATKNASEMVQALTLVYNKARQSSITQEILEVVGGAEALRG